MTNLQQGEEFTGRYLVTVNNRNSQAARSLLQEYCGVKLNTASKGSFDVAEASNVTPGEGLLLEDIGVAIMTPKDEAQFNKMVSAESVTNNEVTIEPERVVHAIDRDFGSYLKGYQDAINSLAANFSGDDEKGNAELDADAQAVNATWGLKATKVVPPAFMWTQNFSGQGIKVAVLDTGFDLTHPDFQGRNIISQSFVPNQAVQDLHGHGTHCTGTAAGPKVPSNPALQRYGVAFGANIYIGKVLNNNGSGADGWILAGINWAISQGCHVISMSLGAPAGGSGYSAAYENAAQAALNNNCLIIAAAGNGGGQPVGHPANCPSIMAIGAVDQNLNKAGFSDITQYPPHGKVDLVGPGVGVFSSWPVSKGSHATLNGTSMATPHVAGIAALYAQSNASLRGMALWQKLLATTQQLPNQPAAHVGAGLVQAPLRRRFFDHIPIPWKPIRWPI